jgi:L-iditol 2-dehydrogenase
MSFVVGEHQGGLSEIVAVPAANAVPMLPGAPADLRVLVEPRAVGVHAAARAGAGPEDKVLIIGAGPIGPFTALALRHGGLDADDIVICDLSDDRLALARALDAGRTVNTRDVPLHGYVRDHMRPGGVDVAFDCVGVEATAADALELTCKGGRTMLVGLMPTAMSINGMPLQRGERSLIGVQQYMRADFTTAMEILAAGALPASDDLVRRYALDEVDAALAQLQQGGTDVLKLVVRP